MAQQKAQGTITIIDTNEIERVYPVYCKGGESIAPSLEPLSNWKEEISEITVTGNYIWQRIVTKKYGINVTAQDYSDAVRLTGLDGIDITDISITYCNHAYNDDSHKPIASGSGAGGHSGWQTNVPSYDSSYPYYWVKTTITYSEGNPSVLIHYDAGLSDANAAAALANSIATHSNEMANGAMSQATANIQTITRLWYAKANSTAPAAPTTHITTSSATTYNAWNIKRPNANDSYPYYFYCDETCTGGGVYSWSEVTLDTSTLSQYQIGALTAKVKNFWWDPSGAHVASGKNGNEVTKETISTYGYHALMGLTGISFNYDSVKVVDLNSTTPSLDFYQPPTISGNTVTQGNKTMMLSANALNFYDPTDGTTEQAKLDANGLILKKGGIQAGDVEQPNFIYLSTQEYPRASYTLTTDVSIDASKNYYILEEDKFVQVIEPVIEDISTYYECTISGLTINDYNPSENLNEPGWKQVIGTKFGVDAEGKLYATDADIKGLIKATDGLQVFDNTTGQLLTDINSIGMDLYGEVIPYYRGGALPSSGWGEIAHFGESVQIGGDESVHTVINNNAISFWGKDSLFGQINFGTLTRENVIETFEWDWSDYQENTDFHNITIYDSRHMPIIEAEFTFTIIKQIEHPVEENGAIIIITDNEIQHYTENMYITDGYISGNFSHEENEQEIYNFSVSSNFFGDESYILWNITITDNKYEQGITSFENFHAKFTYTYDQLCYGPHYHFGSDVIATGTYAFAAGEGTIARKDSQMAIGQYNIPVNDALLVVGNGIDNNNRSNLMAIGNNSIIIGSTDSEHLLIDNNGLNLRKENKTIASFGEDICIGNVNDFHVKVTDDRLSFYDGTNEVAYISDDQLYITKSVVLQQMEVGTPLNSNNEFGQWGWKVRQNSNGQNNLQLKWLG